MPAQKVTTVSLRAQNMRRSYNALSRLTKEKKIPFVVKRVAAKNRKALEWHVGQLGIDEADLLESVARIDKDGTPMIDDQGVITFKDSESRKTYIKESRKMLSEISVYKVYRVEDKVLDQFTDLDYDPDDESEDASEGIFGDWLEYILWMFDDDQGQDGDGDEDETDETPSERKRRRAAEGPPKRPETTSPKKKRPKPRRHLKAGRRNDDPPIRESNNSLGSGRDLRDLAHLYLFHRTVRIRRRGGKTRALGDCWFGTRSVLARRFQFEEGNRRWKSHVRCRL